MKHNLRREIWFEVGGQLIDVLDYDIYSSVVKGVIVKLLQVIAHSTNVEVLCRNISNEYVNEYTSKKVYANAGP